METYLSPALVALVPLVIGLVEIAKGLGVATRYAPLVAIVLGVLGAFVFPLATIPLTVLAGVVVGLSAMGFYAGSKTVAQG